MSLEDVEILFVDDGSTDDSLERAHEWSNRINCARFEILTPTRTGKPGLVRNVGLRQARGELLLCLDPDDTPDPGYIAACIDVFDQDTAVDVVYTDYRENSVDGARDVTLPRFTRALLRTQNGLSPAAMFRRRLWDSGVRYRGNTEYEDWDFWVQCQAVGARFTRIPHVLYSYEIHEANFSLHAVKNDGSAKAMIVLNNPDFFHPQVQEWARDHQRGRLHSQAMQRGYIPTPADVRKLLKDVEQRVRELGSSSGTAA